ncbi:MAG TPA: hypothetical protein GXX36_10985 [Clostridiaceae bacterium]|nr:hypothetical protein [Clostridiaceae bacterium]
MGNIKHAGVYDIKSRIIKITEHLGDCILAAIFCLSMVYAMTTSLLFDYSPLFLYHIIFALLIIFSVMFYNKTTRLISLGAIFLFTLSLAIYLYKTNALAEFIESTGFFMEWVRNYTSVGASFISSYAIILTILICIAVCLPAYFFIVSRFNFFVVLFGGVYLFVIQWIADIFVSYQPFYMFLFVIIIYYFRYIYQKSSSEETADRTSMLLFSIFLLPLCVLILYIVMSLPVSEKPLEWPWLDKKVITAIDYVKNRFSYQTFDRFSIENAGFDDGDSKLGGSVNSDGTPVLKVKTPQRIYLKGSEKDIYDGSSWKSSSEENMPLSPFAYESIDTSSPYLDTFEMEIGLFLYTGDPHVLSMHTKEISIDVQFLNLRTPCIFAPVKITGIKSSGNNPVDIFHNGNGILYTDDYMSKGFEYNIKMRSVDLNDEVVKALLENSHRGFLKKEFRKLRQRYRFSPYSSYVQKADIDRALKRNGKTLLLIDEYISALMENSERIYSRYLQIPDTLPDRVMHLAYGLTLNAKNSYEAVRSIENFLSSNFRYTLTPEPMPEDRDFVDWFLFESREGYCTYYATAMTILTRCIGIPARYVEGYTLPSKQNSDGTYTVTNEQAHAWVEVYFEGFGWLPFEPTPGYNTSVSEQAASVQANLDNVNSNSMVTMPRDNDSNVTDSFSENQPAVTEKPEESHAKLNSLTIPLIVFAFLLLVFSGTITVNYLRRKARLRKFHNALPRQSILLMYGHILDVLSSQGLGLQPGETPVEYSDRIEGCMSSNSSFKRITNIFLTARYANSDVHENEKSEVYSFYKCFLMEIKKVIGSRKYWIYKNILGKL